MFAATRRIRPSRGEGKCSTPVFQFFCPAPTESVSLQFDVPPIGKLERVQFVYDIRSVDGTGTGPGTAGLSVNGTVIGPLAPAAGVPGAAGAESVHRSIDVDAARVRVGTNDLRVALEGIVQLDRMHIELSYGDLPKRRAVRPSGIENDGGLLGRRR